MQAIHQLVAGYVHGDAISNEARALRALFRSWGHPSDIYCEARRIPSELRGDAKDLAGGMGDFAPEDIAILHLSIGSDVNDLFRRLKCRKAIIYHNITPPGYFRIFQEQTASALRRGLEQVRALKDEADVVMAVSKFNAGELRAMGYRDVHVLPLVIDFSRLRGTPDRAMLRKWRDGLFNVLFVGRCAPNKRLEDLVTAFWHFQNHVRSDSRLLLVGSHAGMEPYHALVVSQAKELRLRHVETPGAVLQSQLVAAYEAADVFLCLSEHEGFCIPLLEAMVHHVPVVAFDAGAVAETMDGAGVLVREKNYPLIAETLGRIAADEPLRKAIVAGQDARLARYEALDLEGDLRRFLAPLLV